jgi:hypothetical protein
MHSDLKKEEEEREEAYLQYPPLWQEEGLVGPH